MWDVTPSTSSREFVLASRQIICQCRQIRQEIAGCPRLRHMSAPAFYDELRALRLERLLDASVAIITEEGWDRLSMTKVAQRSGVPRQSLYKEVGTKSELGEAVVRRELERFLA